MPQKIADPLRILALLIFGLSIFACNSQPRSQMKTRVLRLTPGSDIRPALDQVVAQEQWQAGVVITAVGSLTRAAIRFANQDSATILEGHFEIVSLVGTIGPEGQHLHIAVADSTGRTFGGHLMEGCSVYTTAEIALADLEEWRFTKEIDSTYGYRELKVVPRTPKPE